MPAGLAVQSPDQLSVALFEQSPYEAELRTILEQCRQLEQTAAGELVATASPYTVQAASP